MTEAIQTPPADLVDFIVAEVHRQTSEAALRDHVEKKIGAAVSSAVDGAFRSYGDVGKQIEKAVTNSLAIGDRLDVPAYGNMVMAVLRAKMDEVLGELVNERLAKEMSEILSLAPKEVKLSEVVKAMVAAIELSERYGTSVTCLVEESESVQGYFNIYLDPEDGKDKRRYECAVQLGVDRDGRIYSLSIDRKDAKTTVVMGAYDAFKKMVFAAYCSGSKFIVDEDFVSTNIGDF